jgi:hypothetical protein
VTANPPGSRIPLTTAGWSRHHGPALNLPKDVFSITIHPLGLGNHMLSQKLLVYVNDDMFTESVDNHACILLSVKNTLGIRNKSDHRK